MSDSSTTTSEPRVTLMDPEPGAAERTTPNPRRKLRVAAYCRVSTKEEEQLNSYENQCRFYREKIDSEPDWKFAGIYADRGISGTSTRKRDAFNRMIRACQRGSIDMVITKSISRFSRNTEDCLKYIHKLKNLGVVVYFEEQNLRSTDPNAELFITIHGSIAQSESENISKNVAFGMLQRSKEGKVTFCYRHFLGYRRGEDGKPEIDPEQAAVIRRIYSRYLEGASLQTIADELMADGIPSPMGKTVWHVGTIRSILTNVKYKGDAILNKTYIRDVLTKKVMRNRGERPMYYVENSHPAIIDAQTFAKVQEEMARRQGRDGSGRTDIKTQMAKHSGKYALTDILVCGECGTSYRRVVWTVKGEKVPVWRCIGRLSKNRICYHSPTMYEAELQEAIMEAIRRAALQKTDLLDMFMRHIGGCLSEEHGKSRQLEIKVRLAEIETEYTELLNKLSAGSSIEDFDDTEIRRLMEEKHQLEAELAAAADIDPCQSSRLDDILTIVENRKNQPLPFSDILIYQMIDTITVEAEDRIRIEFRGGLVMEQQVYTQRRR